MYYVGLDIGGTFTDCVLVDRQGNHRTAKVLSTKDDAVAGVVAGLPAEPPVTVPADVPLPILTGELAVAERDGRPAMPAAATAQSLQVSAPPGGNQQALAANGPRAVKVHRETAAVVADTSGRPAAGWRPGWSPAK